MTVPGTTSDVADRPAALRLRELGLSAAISAALRAAVELGVADAIGSEPRSAHEVAQEIGAHGPTLHRLLRALSLQEIFALDDDDHFRHTPMSQLLRSDAQPSMRDMVLWGNADWVWTSWPLLAESVRTGQAVVPGLYGKTFFSYLAQDAPDDEAIFQRAMTQASSLTSAAVVRCLDLDGATTVADIGGGQGHLLAALLTAHPQVRGVLFDLPQVLPTVTERLTSGDLAERTTLIGGSCLDAVPVDADIYVIKQILKWDDDSSITTIRNIAAQARPGARVVVVQGLVDAGDEQRYTAAMDLYVLLNVGGQEHTVHDFKTLFEKSGLEFTRLVPTDSQLFLIEATVPEH